MANGYKINHLGKQMSQKLLNFAPTIGDQNNGIDTDGNTYDCISDGFDNECEDSIKTERIDASLNFNTNRQSAAVHSDGYHPEADEKESVLYFEDQKFDSSNNQSKGQTKTQKQKIHNNGANQNSSPIKKSSLHVVAASPQSSLSVGVFQKEDSPCKGREREEKIRLARERKREEQKKKEEELRESIARAEEVRKRQEDERKKRLDELRKREEEHRALVEERRRRLWDEEFERRQAIIKKTAERDARIDFKKPCKAVLSSNQTSQPLQTEVQQKLSKQRALCLIRSGTITIPLEVAVPSEDQGVSKGHSSFRILSKVQHDNPQKKEKISFAIDDHTKRYQIRSGSLQPLNKVYSKKRFTSNSTHRLSFSKGVEHHEDHSSKSEKKESVLDGQLSKSFINLKRNEKEVKSFQIPILNQTALGLSKSFGHSDGTLSTGTPRTPGCSLLSPSSLSRQSPTTTTATASSIAPYETNRSGTCKSSKNGGRKSRFDAAGVRRDGKSGDVERRPRSVAPSYCSSTVSFRIRAGHKSDDAVSEGESGGFCICPRFRSVSPSKSRARSVGNIRRSRYDGNGSTLSKPVEVQNDFASSINVKKTSAASTKTREKTPGGTNRQSMTPAPMNQHQEQQQQAAFDRLRTRRSKTPVVLKSSSNLVASTPTTKAGTPTTKSKATENIMIKSMEIGTNVLTSARRMRTSWAPPGNKEKPKESIKQIKNVSKISSKKSSETSPVLSNSDQPLQNSSAPAEKCQEEETKSGKPEDNIIISSADVTHDRNSTPEEKYAMVSSILSTAVAPDATAAPPRKQLSKVEEHQKKLAENRRLAREKAEREAEEERLRLEKLRLEEEEQLKREEEEAKTQEEEELRLLEEAKKLEHERFLKAVEEENERKKKEEERLEAERKERLEAELKAREEAEKREKEREEKIRKMDEEKKERKKKLEMIMKRVKAEEPTSKLDSPTNEDILTVTSLPHPASQPNFVTSEAAKQVESHGCSDNDLASSFKSPLLQKMLGGKLKAGKVIVSSTELLAVSQASRTNVEDSAVKVPGDVLPFGTISADFTLEPVVTAADVFQPDDKIDVSLSITEMEDISVSHESHNSACDDSSKIICSEDQSISVEQVPAVTITECDENILDELVSYGDNICDIQSASMSKSEKSAICFVSADEIPAYMQSSQEVVADNFPGILIGDNLTEKFLDGDCVGNVIEKNDVLVDLVTSPIPDCPDEAENSKILHHPNAEATVCDPDSVLRSQQNVCPDNISLPVNLDINDVPVSLLALSLTDSLPKESLISATEFKAKAAKFESAIHLTENVLISTDTVKGSNSFLTDPEEDHNQSVDSEEMSTDDDSKHSQEFVPGLKNLRNNLLGMNDTDDPSDDLLGLDVEETSDVKESVFADKQNGLVNLKDVTLHFDEATNGNISAIQSTFSTETNNSTNLFVESMNKFSTSFGPEGTVSEASML